MEPVTFIAATLSSTAAGEALSRGLDALLKKPDTITPLLHMMEEKLDAIIDGPFHTAQLALQRGRPERAMDKIEDWLGTNIMNPYAWAIYANMLAHVGNPREKERSVEIYKQIIDWFGPECPALSKEIKKAIQPFDQVVVPSSKPVKISIEGPGADWNHTHDAVFSSAGVATAFYQSKISLFKDRTAVVVHFHPWTKKNKFGLEDDIILSDDNWSNISISRTNGRHPSTVVSRMTGRFIVIGSDLLDSDVYDLHTKKTEHLPWREIDALFGKKEYGNYALFGKPSVQRGVRIEFEDKDDCPEVVARPTVMSAAQIQKYKGRRR